MVTRYFKAIKEGNIIELIKSHQEAIDWRKDQTKCIIVKESIKFNERAIELLKAGNIIQYSIEYAKLEIPTPAESQAFFIAGHKHHDSSIPTCLQSDIPTTLAVVIGSEEDVIQWINENAEQLHGAYGQLEYQEQNAEWDDIKKVVI